MSTSSSPNDELRKLIHDMNSGLGSLSQAMELLNSDIENKSQLVPNSFVEAIAESLIQNQWK